MTARRTGRTLHADSEVSFALYPPLSHPADFDRGQYVCPGGRAIVGALDHPGLGRGSDDPDRMERADDGLRDAALAAAVGALRPARRAAICPLLYGACGGLGRCGGGP